MKKYLETGIEVIDYQHEEFHRMLDSFMLEMMDNVDLSNLEAIKKYILFLDQYKAKHFNLEEKIMKEISYPSIDEHIQNHLEFSEKYKELSQKILSSSQISQEKLKEFHKFLMDWFNYDIRMHDKKMAEFIQKTAKKKQNLLEEINKLHKNYKSK